MSDPAFKLYKLACEYRFVPKLGFYDHMGKLGEALMRDYKHWSREPNKVSLSNFENRTLLVLEHNRLLAVADVPSGIDVLTSRFSRAWKEYYAAIKPDSFHRLGVRMQGLVPVELKLEELVALTRGKLFNTESRLSAVLGADVTDYSYTVNTILDGNTMRLICGPMRDVEVPSFFKPAILVHNENEKIPEIQHPSLSLWIDCDMYCERPGSEAHKTFLDVAVRKIEGVVQGLVKYLLG